MRSRAVVIVVLFALLALLPWAALLGAKVQLSQSLLPPSWAHPLGTDGLGRDLLGRLSDAVRGSVLPLWSAVGLGALLGLGVAVGTVVLGEQRLWRGPVTAWRAVVNLGSGAPVGVVVFAAAAFLEKTGLGVLAVTFLILAAIRTSQQVMDLYRQDCSLESWTAYRALGGRTASLVWNYGLRGGWGERLGEGFGAQLRVSVAVEASLSYLGFGVQEPDASFGNLLAAHFEQSLHGHWQALGAICLGLGLCSLLPAALVRLGRDLYWRSAIFARRRLSPRQTAAKIAAFTRPKSA